MMSTAEGVPWVRRLRAATARVVEAARTYRVACDRYDGAAMAGALLRLHAERRGIEVHAHEPSTREVKLGRKERRKGPKHRRP